MDNLIQVNKDEWNDFVEWAFKVLKDCAWKPITMADRVNILNAKDEIIAYKYREDDFYANKVLLDKHRISKEFLEKREKERKLGLLFWQEPNDCPRCKANLFYED